MLSLRKKGTTEGGHVSDKAGKKAEEGSWDRTLSWVWKAGEGITRTTKRRESPQRAVDQQDNVRTPDLHPGFGGDGRIQSVGHVEMFSMVKH